MQVKPPAYLLVTPMPKMDLSSILDPDRNESSETVIDASAVTVINPKTWPSLEDTVLNGSQVRFLSSRHVTGPRRKRREAQPPLEQRRCMCGVLVLTVMHWRIVHCCQGSRRKLPLFSWGFNFIGIFQVCGQRHTRQHSLSVGSFFPHQTRRQSTALSSDRTRVEHYTFTVQN